MRDRAQAYCNQYPEWPAGWPCISHEQGRQVLYATWLIGNDYRNKMTYYGAYPNGFVDRVLALFPDVEYYRKSVLHVFGGSVNKRLGITLDLRKELHPTVVGTVYEAATLLEGRQFPLVMADPPYTAQDALQYGTPMVNRGKAMRALADVTHVGGHLCWLDTVWPMHRKDQWVTVGRITVIRSTNHRVRLLSIFERVAS